MEKQTALHTIGLILGVLAVVFLVITFFVYIILGLIFIVCFSLIAFAVIIGIISLIFIFAVPYYAITKKPEVQERGGYTLDEVKSKDDEKDKNLRS